MFILVVAMEIHIPYSRSLKEKRSVRHSLMEGLRRTFGVCVAEVEHPDAHQLLSLGATAVSGDAELLDRMGRDIPAYVERQGDGVIASFKTACVPWRWE